MNLNNKKICMFCTKDAKMSLMLVRTSQRKVLETFVENIISKLSYNIVIKFLDTINILKRKLLTFFDFVNSIVFSKDNKKVVIKDGRFTYTYNLFRWNLGC